MNPVQMQKTRKEQFVSFLEQLASGTCSSSDWHQFAVAHYVEEPVEKARIQLVRASIASGSWTSGSVPETLRRVARELAIDLRDDVGT